MTVEELVTALLKLPADDQGKTAVYTDDGTTYEIDKVIHADNRDVWPIVGAHNVIELV